MSSLLLTAPPRPVLLAMAFVGPERAGRLEEHDVQAGVGQDVRGDETVRASAETTASTASTAG